MAVRLAQTRGTVYLGYLRPKDSIHSITRVARSSTLPGKLDSDGASGSKVDDEVVQIGLLHGDVCRFGATQNLIHEFSGSSEHVRDVRSVRQQSSVGLS